MKKSLKIFAALMAIVVFISSCGKRSDEKYVTNELNAKEVIQSELTRNFAEDWSTKIIDSLELSDPTKDYLNDLKFVVMNFISDSVEVVDFEGAKDLVKSKDSVGLDVWDFEVMATSCYDQSGASTCSVERVSKDVFLCKREGFADFKFKVRIDTDSVGKKSCVVEYLKY